MTTKADFPDYSQLAEAVSLCRQCSRECSDPEVDRIFVEEDEKS